MESTGNPNAVPCAMGDAQRSYLPGQRTLRHVITALGMMALVVLAACGDDEENKARKPPVDEACANITCDEGGVCKAGECVNATDCESEDKNCVAGYLCSVAGNICIPKDPCSPSQPCARGTCNADGACVNADSCADSGQCLQGFACGDAAKCISDPCQDEANQCARGICQVGTGACVNAQACSSTTEGTQCLENFRCIGGECKDEAGFCGQTDCSATGGVCNFAATGMDDRCVNAQPGACGGDDANCLKGFFCDEADNTCKPDQCEVDGCEEDGGVCDKASGSCVNPATCTGAADCLKENFCVAEGGQNVCKPKAQACAAANCTGLQLCTNDDAGFTVSCGEPETCQNALDCLGTRVCGEALVCADAVACVPDANEPNDDSASATDYFVARQGRLVRGSLCPQDVDVIAFDTRQDVEETGRLVVEVQVASSRLVGQGELKAELMYGGNVVQSGTTTDGKVRLEQPVTLAFVGLYELKLSQEGTLSEQGIDYQVSMDLIDNQVVQACMGAKMLNEGVAETSSTLSGASTAITSSCGDPQGKAFEDIYTITLAKQSYLSVFVDAGDMSNVGVSLRRECLSNESEIPGACADNEGPGGIERVEALLDPGTYFVVVQGGNETLGGTYEITWTRRDVTCTSSDSKCVSMASAEICRPDGQGFTVQSCDEGCNMTTGACRPLKGEVCGTAQVVNETTPLDKYVVQWAKLKNDYNVAVTGCVPSTDGLVNATSGPDQAFLVTVPPQFVLVASVTQESNAVGAKTDASLYVVEDCLNTDGTCKVGVNGGDSTVFGKQESIYLTNEDPMMAKTYRLIVDTANASTYVNSLLNVQVLPKACDVGSSVCEVDPGTSMAATKACNPSGTGLDAPVDCGNDSCSFSGICGNFDICLGAPLVGDGFTETVTIGSQTDTVNIESTCKGLSTPTGAEEVFYSVKVPAGQVLEVNVTSSSTSYDPLVAIFEDCANLSTTCLAGAERESDVTARWANTTAAEKTVVFVVSVDDTFISSFTDFDITVSIKAPECMVPGEALCDAGNLKTCNDTLTYNVYACNGTCGTVTPNRCDTPTGDVCVDSIILTGATGSVSGTYSGASSSAEIPVGVSGQCTVFSGNNTDGKDRIYQITLKDQELLEASLTTTSTTSSLFFTTSCNNPADSCVANGEVVGSSAPVRYVNNTGADQVVFVNVDNTSSFVSSTFTLNYTVTAGKVCVAGRAYCDSTGTGIEVCDATGSALVATTSCAMGATCSAGRCTAELAADTCAMAPTITSGYSVIADLTKFTSDQSLSALSCAGEITEGRDFFHQVSVPAGHKLVVTSKSIDNDIHSLYITEGCVDPAASCLTGVRIGFAGQRYQDTLEWVNTTAMAKVVTVGMDAATSDEGLFALSFDTVAPNCTTAGSSVCNGKVREVCDANLFTSSYTCSSTCGVATAGRCDMPNGNDCREAVTLSGALGSVSGTYAQATNTQTLLRSYNGACRVINGDETAGPDRFYAIQVGNGELLRASLSTSSATASLYFLDRCAKADKSCVANLTDPGASTFVEYVNTTGASQTIFVGVDTISTSNSSTFDLDYELVSGFVCAPGTTRCNAAGTGVELCRPNGSGYRASASCAMNETCTSGRCIAPSMNNPADVCTTAPLVAAGYSGLVDLSTLTSDQSLSASSCTGDSTTGADAFYRIAVPSQKLLKIKTIGLDADVHMIYVFDDCMDPDSSCFVGTEVDSNPEDYNGSLAWLNADPAAKTVIVALDTDSSFSDGWYGIEFDVTDPECIPSGAGPMCTLNSIETCTSQGELVRYACDTSGGASCGTINPGRCDNPSGNVCADPFVVNVPATLPATLAFSGDFADFTPTQNNITSSAATCTGFSANGPDAIYEVALPPKTKVDATLDSPISNVDVSLYLLDTCGGGNSACLDGSDSFGAPETASYINTSATDTKTIYVIADAFSSFTTSGDFALDLVFTAVP